MCLEPPCSRLLACCACCVPVACTCCNQAAASVGGWRSGGGGAATKERAKKTAKRQRHAAAQQAALLQCHTMVPVVFMHMLSDAGMAGWMGNRGGALCALRGTASVALLAQAVNQECKRSMDTGAPRMLLHACMSQRLLDVNGATGAKNAAYAAFAQQAGPAAVLPQASRAGAKASLGTRLCAAVVWGVDRAPGSRKASKGDSRCLKVPCASDVL